MKTLEEILYISWNSFLLCQNEFESLTKKGKIQVNDELLQRLIKKDINSKCYSEFLQFYKYNYKNNMKKSQKSTKKSIEARNKGNNLMIKSKHNQQDHEEILRFYCQSIAFAPLMSEELASAYGNRSYLFLHLKKYDKSIGDIDKALNITSSCVLKIKLLSRKMTCLKKTNSDKDDKRVIWEMIRNCFDNMDGDLKDDKIIKLLKKTRSGYLDQMKEFIPQENVKLTLQYTTEAVSLRHSEKQGRHLVATRNIAPGEPVIVTKPLVSSWNSKKFYSLCSHCVSFMWNGIPCDECSLCMYCSDECKTESWKKYHKIECKILPHINFTLELYFQFQVVVRTLIMGINQAGSLANLQDQTKQVDDLRDKYGSIRKENLFGDNFLDYYSLPFTKDKNPILIRFVKNASFLLMILIKNSNIIGENLKSMTNKELTEENLVIFAGTLIVKLLMIYKCNERIKYSIIFHDNCYQNKFSKDCLESYCQRGSVVEIFQSMMERNCDPNVHLLFTNEEGKMVYICIKPIKKNEKITLCLWKPFYTHDSELNSEVERKYKAHNCPCRVCSEGWPGMRHLIFLFATSPSSNNLPKRNEYMYKIDKTAKVMIDKSLKLSKKDFDEIAQNANDGVQLFGQPTFFSSSLLTALIHAAEKMYGMSFVEIPERC